MPAIVPTSVRHVMCLRRQRLEEEDESSAVSKRWTTELLGKRYIETETRSSKDNEAPEMLKENSRGLPASEITPQSRWLTGLAFLCHNQEEWPAQTTPPPRTDETEEVKPSILVTAVDSSCRPVLDPAKLCGMKYRRVIAWTRRHCPMLAIAMLVAIASCFILNAATRASEGDARRSGPLSSQEMKDAERVFLKQTQKTSYPEEEGRLIRRQELPTKSSLLPLSPYCDENGLLKVRGRLGNAPVSEDTRHAVILPQRGEVTRLVILHEHAKCGHACVERMVNSRPITHVSSDPEALTPNHSLLGGASRHLAPGLVGRRDMCSRRRWKQSQAVAEHWWKRWTKEYLPSLVQRSKWHQDQRNLQVGDLVLMADPNLSRGSWPLARVNRVFTAEDGRIRSAELRTASGKLYTRLATKICLLEEDCN